MIKAGIIGLGVGEQHIFGYEQHPDCIVVSICDFDAQKLKEVSERHPNIIATNNPMDILLNKDIDVVTIASYDQFHHDQIMVAIEQGKHIFVEKPLCLYQKEAEEIAERLRANPCLKLSSNLILRKSERFIDLKERIATQEIGNIYHMNAAYNYGRLHKITNGWRADADFYSIIYGGGVHMIDLLLWLSNKRATKVISMGNNLMSNESNFSNVDLSISLIEFEDGSNAHLSCNFGCVFPHFHQLEIYGSKATFINDHAAARLYKERDVPTYEEINTAYPGVHKGDLLYNFVDAILSDKQPAVDKKDIFDCMSVCFALERALETKKLEAIKYFEF